MHSEYQIILQKYCWRITLTIQCINKYSKLLAEKQHTSQWHLFLTNIFTIQIHVRHVQIIHERSRFFWIPSEYIHRTIWPLCILSQLGLTISSNISQKLKPLSRARIYPTVSIFSWLKTQQDLLSHWQLPSFWSKTLLAKGSSKQNVEQIWVCRESWCV